MILASASLAMMKCVPLSNTALVALMLSALLPTLRPFSPTDQYFCTGTIAIL